MLKRERKAYRMEIRRKLGLRVPRPPLVITKVRRAPHRVANACFRCRVSFKRAPLPVGHTHICPNCGGEAAEMGHYFKAPRRSETKQWRKVQLLWLAGYRFNGWNYGPPFPAKLRDVKAFIRDNPRHYKRLRSYWE